MDPTRTTTKTATTILTPSIQSLEGSSEKRTPKRIDTIAATIKILTIKSLRASHT